MSLLLLGLLPIYVHQIRDVFVLDHLLELLVVPHQNVSLLLLVSDLLIQLERLQVLAQVVVEEVH